MNAKIDYCWNLKLVIIADNLKVDRSSLLYCQNSVCLLQYQGVKESDTKAECRVSPSFFSGSGLREGHGLYHSDEELKGVMGPVLVGLNLCYCCRGRKSCR